MASLCGEAGDPGSSRRGEPSRHRAQGPLLSLSQCGNPVPLAGISQGGLCSAGSDHTSTQIAPFSTKPFGKGVAPMHESIRRNEVKWKYFQPAVPLHRGSVDQTYAAGGEISSEK